MAKGWSLLEQGNFLRKMGELLERGYSYSDAVESLIYQMPVKRHMELRACLEQLKAGQPLHIVLATLKFQKDLIGYIYFADKHGGMLEAISEGSKLTLHKNISIEKLKKVILYPAFLFFMTNILFLFVERTLLPQYFNLYDSMGLEVNIFTKVVSAFGTLLPWITVFFLLSVVMLLIVYYLYFIKLPILNQRKYLLKIPFIGPVLRLIQTQYFTLQLGYLLSGGLSVHESLQLFESAPRNLFYRDISIIINGRLKRGEDLPQILMQLQFFEKELPVVVNHGQTNGRLERELLFFSKSCLNKLEERIEKGLKHMQPILYAVIAILVISMYLSIMIPMFRLLNGI
nr:competence type IV pilus assembly protein ComGB [Pseudoneobacillus rhizosphaerae]